MESLLTLRQQCNTAGSSDPQFVTLRGFYLHFVVSGSYLILVTYQNPTKDDRIESVETIFLSDLLGMVSIYTLAALAIQR